MAPLDRLLALLGLDFDLDLRDVPFHRITPELHLGARPTPDDVGALREAGITHVVSCLEEEHRADMAFLGGPFTTRFLPLRDSVEASIEPALPVFFAAMEEAEAEGGQVLVHCRVGVSRSAALATAWVMRRQALPFFEAWEHVQSRRPQALPNVAFASQLQHLEGLPDRGPCSLARYLHGPCRVPVEQEVLEEALASHGYQALPAIRSIFDGEVPRVVQGVRR